MNKTESTQSKKPLNVKLCGRTGSCCPTLSEEVDGTFKLVDDYEGKVILTKEQLHILKDIINEQL